MFSCDCWQFWLSNLCACIYVLNSRSSLSLDVFFPFYLVMLLTGKDVDHDLDEDDFDPPKRTVVRRGQEGEGLRTCNVQRCREGLKWLCIRNFTSK